MIFVCAMCVLRVCVPECLLLLLLCCMLLLSVCFVLFSCILMAFLAWFICWHACDPTPTTSDKHAAPVAGSPSPPSKNLPTHPYHIYIHTYYSSSCSSSLLLPVSGMRLSLQLMAFNGIPVVFVFVAALALPLRSPLSPFSTSFFLSLCYLLKDLEQISKSISCVNFVSVFKRFSNFHWLVLRFIIISVYV